jgi:DNA-binding winged helix-turn-helix (wHTH) protein
MAGGIARGAGRVEADHRQDLPASHEARTKSPEHGRAADALAGASSRPVRLRVGEAVVDLERQVLLDAHGHPVALRARAWMVLSHLAERAGHLVGKDALMEAVWSDCIVTDDSLVQAVSDIRRALGPAARHALRTVPRRGYLLLAEAEPSDASVAAVAAARDPQRTDATDEREVTERALAEQADRVFVGREAELRRLLDAARGSVPTRVAFLHGPGGIGKSMLLERLKRRAAGLGLRVVGLDAALVEPEVDALLSALSRAAGLRVAPVTVEALADAWPAAPTLLAIDTAERIACLQPLLLDRLLPALPAGTRTVLAGRDPPDVRWHAHPRWGAAVEAIGLAALDGPDSVALLERLGVDAAMRPRLRELAGGHPLALALLAGQAARLGALPDQIGADVLGVLMRRCVEQAPDAAHRRALQVAALLDRTTETLLARTVPDAPAEVLFDWLARQGYVRRHADGLAVHELVRAAVTADLQARAPETARRLQLSVFAALTDRLRALPEDGPVTVGVTRLLRVVPTVRVFFADGLERYLVENVRLDDMEALRAFALRGLPPAEHRAFAHWIGHPAARWQVVREDGRRLCGVSGILRLDRVDAADGEADPLVGKVLRALGGAPSGVAMMARFTVPEGERGPRNPSMNALQCNQARIWGATPTLGPWVITSVHPERYHELFRIARFAPMPGCEVSADGITIGCFLHDFSTEPWERWFERITGAAAAGTGAAAR